MKGIIPAGFAALFLSAQSVSAFLLEGAAGYAILFQGTGSNTLQVTNVTIQGNLGVGNSGKANFSGPGTVGRIDFSAGNSGQFSSNNSSNVYAGPVYQVGAVTDALNYLNSLNTTLGAESGTNVSINGSTTINASAGTFNGSDSVFNVISFKTTNGDTLTINGDGVHDVVLNFAGVNANFNNQVVLNGLSPDQVIYNFLGGSNLNGGPTLQINNNGHNHPSNLVQGVFLDPNGVVSITNTNLNGRVFGGGTHDMQVVSGDDINVPVPIPEADTWVLMSLGLVTLGVARGVQRRKAEHS
jgi:hypothetical protein